jgi:energy-converting hydrogenase Eha subunit G
VGASGGHDKRADAERRGWTSHLYPWKLFALTAGISLVVAVVGFLTQNWLIASFHAGVAVLFGVASVLGYLASRPRTKW